MHTDASGPAMAATATQDPGPLAQLAAGVAVDVLVLRAALAGGPNTTPADMVTAADLAFMKACTPQRISRLLDVLQAATQGDRLVRLMGQALATAAAANTAAGEVLQLVRWRPLAERPCSNRTVALWHCDEGLLAGWYEHEHDEWIDASHGGAIPVEQLEGWADVPGPSFPPGEDWIRDNDTTFAVLQLVGGHEVPFSAVQQWTDAQCQAAEEWAFAKHLRASDNDDVQVPPMPPCVAAHASPPAAGGRPATQEG